MKTIMRLSTVLFALLFASVACAQSSDDAFRQQLNVDALKPLTIQHNQTLKTLDSFARQSLTAITGKGSYQGQPAVYTILDMTFRPEKYQDLKLLKIKNATLRQDMQLLQGIDDAEKERILKEGTISVKFWNDPEVQQLMQDLQANAVFKAQTIGQVQEGAMTLQTLSAPMVTPYHIFPPPTHADPMWKALPDLFGQSAAMAGMGPMSGMGMPPMHPTTLPASSAKPDFSEPVIAGYQQHVDALQTAAEAWSNLKTAWVAQDAPAANAAIATLAQELPAVSPDVYPSYTKRRAEVIYNSLSQLTKPGIMLYLTALVLFLLSAQSGKASLRLWGLRMMMIAFIVHTGGIAVRWWLVEKSVGNWFEAIPIKNMFESVMFSAWFGAAIALSLEIGLIQAIINKVFGMKVTGGAGRALFGAAGSFVGTAAMVALLTVPYFYRDIGGEISQVQGVLMSYWLYIHVTMVTASYALIAMGFLLSCWWLWGYYKEYGTFSRLPNPHKLSADAARGFDVSPTTGGVAAVSFWSNIAQLLFVAKPQVVLKPVHVDDEAPQFQAELDACNLVILHLVFWILGCGIILGAVWADMSWGRPWGWDPKETFALVTWIVYLIIIHVRVIAHDKAWWTAVLSVIGFFIMLFNWIGVNFFLTGLHSYAG